METLWSVTPWGLEQQNLHLIQPKQTKFPKECCVEGFRYKNNQKPLKYVFVLFLSTYFYIYQM